MKNKVLKTYPLPHGFCPDRVDHGEKGGPGGDFGDQAVRHRVTPFPRERHEKWVNRLPAGERDENRFSVRHPVKGFEIVKGGVRSPGFRASETRSSDGHSGASLREAA